MKGFITILLLMLFTSTLSLDVYAKTSFDYTANYELMDVEEDQDAEEEDSKEEFKKDEYFSYLESLNFLSNLIDLQFSERQYVWKLDVQQILLRPPMA
ncbi:hypothetical protein [uncultured Roseivirga sp.]|uniref:hypothetical protein n=1 Tax=uncultured Roseivirga sp. TaxID=543088 RepID=UPI00258BC645|nr:hypothetical protein [uncultured Roseivirga sp.]